MIPESFQLGPYTWKVVWRKLKGKYGECSAGSLEIRLHPKLLDGDPVLLLHTFEHELGHAIRYAYGETNHDEVVVDGHAALRTQYELSKRGELEDPFEEA